MLPTQHVHSPHVDEPLDHGVSAWPEADDGTFLRALRFCCNDDHLNAFLRRRPRWVGACVLVGVPGPKVAAVYKASAAATGNFDSKQQHLQQSDQNILNSGLTGAPAKTACTTAICTCSTDTTSNFDHVCKHTGS